MKKGFTLIELLAVIVILAIITLIAVPIVINIINDSKKSSDEQTVELYLDTVKKEITKKQLSNSNFNPNKCIIQGNGDLDCYNEDKSLGIVEIDMKGKIPEKGIIEIKDNKFKFKNIKFNGKVYYESYSELINDVGEKGISIGDKYAYDVNDEYSFYFYILSFNEDDTVNLIMDRNICENGEAATSTNICLYAWHSLGYNNNYYGPNTAMLKLYEATKSWINVPDMIMNYYDEGNRYISIITNKSTKVTVINGRTEDLNTTIGTSELPLKARLARQIDIENTCTLAYEKCPAWLIDNLEETENYSQKNNIDNIKGYWLLSSNPNYDDRAGYIYYDGTKSYGSKCDTYGCGIRPVITVSITDLK